MEIRNELYPVTDDQLSALGEPGPDGPIVMVNLFKFRDRAAYPDGSESQLPGRDAYQRFAEPCGRLIREHGGHFLFAGNPTFLALGQADELWDEVAVVQYPDRPTFAKMTGSAEFRAVTHHREAGVEGQLLIETTWIPIPGED